MRAFDQVVTAERLTQSAGNFVTRNHGAQLQVEWNHLQVFAGQQDGGLRNVGRVATELNAVFRRTQNRRADALTRWQQRRRQGRLVNPVSHRLTEQFAQIAKVAHFAAVHILTDTAREHDAVQLTPVFHRVCQEQMVQIFACEALVQHTHQGVCHPPSHLGQLVSADLLAHHPVKACLLGQITTCWVQACEGIFLVHHHQPATQVNRRGGHQFTVLNQAQLGGATANVDVQNALLVVVTAFGRA